jgi:hypothetical protein
MATTGYDYTWQSWSSKSTTSYSTASSTVWDTWTSDSTASSSDHIWYDWSVDYQTSSKRVRVIQGEGTNAQVVWSAWIDDVEVSGSKLQLRDTIRERLDKGIREYRTFSTEYIRAQSAQAAIRIEWAKLIAEETKQEKEEAELTAQQLLLDIVGKDELQRYKDTKRLFVKGKRFDYVLEKGKGVHRIEKNKVVDFVEKKEAEGQFICIHPKKSFNYPDTDNVIALKLSIENDEDEFLRIGNLHKGTTPIPDFDKVVGM